MLNVPVSPSSPLMRYLYVSQLADGVASAAVTQILRHARERNRAAGIGGALLFDGEYFGQLLEGEPGAVAALAARIRVDSRHRAMQVLLNEGAVPAAAAAARWQTGYCEHGLLAALRPACIDAGAAPLAGFLNILERADMSP